MSRKIFESILMFVPAVAVARRPASDFANPVAAVVLIGVILMCLGHWLKGALENPVGASRVVLACIASLHTQAATADPRRPYSQHFALPQRRARVQI